MRLGLILLSFLVLAGCHSMQAPADFVQADSLQRSGYVTKAVSADGVVVGLRAQSNSPYGSLEFWSAALAKDLQGRCYSPVKSEEVKSCAGRPGRLMEFSVCDRGAPFSYLVAVFMDDREVLLAEAGGPSPAVEKNRDAIRASLLSTR